MGGRGDRAVGLARVGGKVAARPAGVAGGVALVSCSSLSRSTIVLNLFLLAFGQQYMVGLSFEDSNGNIGTNDLNLNPDSICYPSGTSVPWETPPEGGYHTCRTPHVPCPWPMLRPVVPAADHAAAARSTAIPQTFCRTW